MFIMQRITAELIQIVDLNNKFREFNIRRDPECPVCGDHPTIRELIDYEEFCGLRGAHDTAGAP